DVGRDRVGSIHLSSRCSHSRKRRDLPTLLSDAERFDFPQKLYVSPGAGFRIRGPGICQRVGGAILRGDRRGGQLVRLPRYPGLYEADEQSLMVKPGVRFLRQALGYSVNTARTESNTRMGTHLEKEIISMANKRRPWLRYFAAEDNGGGSGKENSDPENGGGGDPKKDDTETKTDNGDDGELQRLQKLLDETQRERDTWKGHARTWEERAKKHKNEINGDVEERLSDLEQKLQEK